MRRNDFRNIDSADAEISKTCLSEFSVQFSLIVGFQKRKELILGGKLSDCAVHSNLFLASASNFFMVAGVFTKGSPGSSHSIKFVYGFEFHFHFSLPGFNANGGLSVSGRCFYQILGGILGGIYHSTIWPSRQLWEFLAKN